MVLLVFGQMSAEACTNLLISKGASKDGSTMITYAADSHVLYGELYHWPAADHPAGTMLQVREWDTGKILGEIPQVAHTYNVTGNMNEHQLAIAETTFGGRKSLRDPKGIMDYGSLIYITLQRAKTAQEAITVMTDLVEKYGYYSSGESFSIADKNEVWVLEMISKGTVEKGAVWVAQRIPDGYISAHANQARITKINFNEPENFRYSSDVVSFARAQKFFEGKDKHFDFSAAYAPLDFGAVRFCDARAWSIFNRVNPTFGKKYEAYAMGDLTKKRMPLYVKPDHQLTVKDAMELMRDHYEGTPMDMTKDVGAGPSACPYRWRPLTWESEGKTYFNERAISTQQTGFSFVAQCRDWMPDALGGILWFGVDDTYSTCYTPIYSAATQVPSSFANGNGDMLTYSDDAAFWVFNRVTNLAYMRYDEIIKDIRKKQTTLEAKYIRTVKAIDVAAKELYQENPADAIEFVTDFSVDNANKMVEQWRELEKYLWVKYLDGNIKVEENGKFKYNPSGLMPVSPKNKPYSEEYRKKIVQDTGDRLLEPAAVQ
ncbi:peptidase C69 (plasmid) [Persicobacter psychrovividus]|uniref:Dipeptidase n=2 Tax=Persicobacter psychrovividus TaxID=387638 RepID=A0ABN6LD15_9BACT|nr:peptidase C69 [Persicobacter psychrovividus]